jgi:hypothetical protein
MKWTVVFRPSAQNHLAEIWTDAIDRQAVTDAANEIERLLARSPLNVGESREGNTRIVMEPPLAVLYDVFPDDARIEVFAVFSLDEKT